MGRRDVAVQGTCAPGFEPLRDELRRNLAQRGGIGEGFCVMRDGEVLVDLWGGVADVASGRPWEADTLGVVFSATKGLVAQVLLLLHDRGLLDHDAPVARYWPEFARRDKGAITVRTLLSHRAGLVSLPRDPGLDDLESPERCAELAANTAPRWAPGTDQGYHGVTYGFFAAELVRRLAGRSAGSILRDEIARPLGADVHLGLPEALEGRVATLYPQTPQDVLRNILPRVFASPKVEGRVYRQVLFGGDSDSRAAFARPSALGPRGIQNFNLPRVHRMELGWASAIASARGLARAYQPLACGGEGLGLRLFSPAAARLPHARDSFVARDRVLRREMGFTLGFVKEPPGVFGPEPAAFGHPGAGGALGWADPERRLSIGYVPNRMDFHIRSKRALALCRTLYQCLP